MEKAFHRFMSAIDLEQFDEMINSTWAKHISYSDVLYLFIINHQNKTTVSELSKRMNISRPAVTQKINELEKSGLVNKIQSEDDKRYQYIYLSKDVLKNSENTKTSSVLDVVKEKYSEEEIEVFERILNTMADYILEGKE